MSRIFYDHLIIFEEVDREIKNVTDLAEEREELWQLIDEIIHHRVLASILDILPREHHEEFLLSFHESPYSDTHIVYLNKMIKGDIEELLRNEIKSIEAEILHEIRGKGKRGQ